MRLILGILIGILFVIGVLIGLQNSQPVELRYLVGSTIFPLIGIMALELVIVALFVAFLMSLKILGRGAEIRRLERLMRERDTEIRTLKETNTRLAAALPPASVDRGAPSMSTVPGATLFK